MDDKLCENYELLAIAIAKTAADDYRRALRRSFASGKASSACAKLEKFFRSAWGNLLCWGNGEYIMRKTKEEEKEKFQRANRRKETHIDNYNCYTEGMAKTMEDKAWWIDRIDSSAQTVIDFGCADGAMAAFLEKRYPNRFSYIGIDNNEEMLEKANKSFANNPRFRFVSSVSDVPRKCYNPEKTVLLLNSVVHEIYSYMKPDEQERLFSGLKELSARYIAIRDMHIIDSEKHLDEESTEIIIKQIATSEHNRALQDWTALGRFPVNDINFLSEFLLKYFYHENWERELNERYLWDWQSSLTNFFSDAGYRSKYTERFSLPFLQNKWQTDFKINFDYPTHVKLLLEKT